MKNKKDIITSGLTGAAKGACVAAAGSIISGVAMTSVPVQIMWITVASTTIISAPIVVSVAIGGAVVGGAAAAYANYRKQKGIEEEFERLSKGK